MKWNKSFLALGVVAGIAGIASYSGFASAGTGCLGTGANCNTSTTVTVTITPGDICLGSTGTFDFGSYQVSSSAQTVNGTFSSPFWVDDLKGTNSGWYTTVQMSGNLLGAGSGSIPAANVSMKTSAVGTAGVTTMAGSTNPNVVVNAGMAAYQTLETPRRLLERPAGENFGLIGQYGTTPSLQLLIPAYQSVGSYSGTLVYTLYNN